ncbi:MAG: HlyC/CorC family transporter [Saprospiraceae bacterium]|nr:HlyC/CorC family transporter [Saprospiraceae bacterium]
MVLTLFIIIFLALSAFFSGSEIAFVSANKLGIEVLRNKGSKRGTILARFYDRPNKFISAMLVGNNISLVAFTYLMEILLKPLLVPAIGDTAWTLLALTIIVTVVVLIFGEFLPKTLFRLYSNEILLRFTYPLYFFKYILAFPTWIMNKLSNFILSKIFRVPIERVEHTLTRVDLEHFIDNNISEEEDIDKEILTNALNLSRIKVRDCFIPRTEIVFMDVEGTIEELTQIFKESRHSRILIVDGDIENVLGYIHHQQLLTNPMSVRRLILDILYVPEAMNAQDLMLRFIREGTNIACVVDEYGGTAGIITLEDILEEIFGEIEDEHDEEEFIEQQINEDEFMLSGRLEIDYLNEKYDELNFPEGDYHTLSGYIVMTSESIPEEDGSKFEMDGYCFVVERLSDTKIELVRVIRLSSEDN